MRQGWPFLYFESHFVLPDMKISTIGICHHVHFSVCTAHCTYSLHANTSQLEQEYFWSQIWFFIKIGTQEILIQVILLVSLTKKNVTSRILVEKSSWLCLVFQFNCFKKMGGYYGAQKDTNQKFDIREDPIWALNSNSDTF